MAGTQLKRSSEKVVVEVFVRAKGAVVRRVVGGEERGPWGLGGWRLIYLLFTSPSWELEVSPLSRDH